MPTLVSIMNAPPEKIENDLPSLALDVLTIVVRNSPPPLTELMILQVNFVSLIAKFIRDFAFRWDSDIKDLCTQNKQAKSGIPREKLSLVLEKVCVHECL